MKYKEIIKKIEIPEGYELDEEKTTPQRIVLNKKEKEVKRWEDLTTIEGYYLTEGSKIMYSVSRHPIELTSYKNVARSVKVAKSMLAMSQISQLLPFYGGEITEEEWNDEYCTKWALCYSRELKTCFTCCIFESIFNALLVFHQERQAIEFFNNNEQLVKDYFMVD